MAVTQSCYWRQVVEFADDTEGGWCTNYLLESLEPKDADDVRHAAGCLVRIRKAIINGLYAEHYREITDYADGLLKCKDLWDGGMVDESLNLLLTMASPKDTIGIMERK